MAVHRSSEALVREQIAPSVPEVASPPEGTTVLKVSAQSRPGTVAGAIAGVLRSGQRANVQAIGAGAVNQAVKAIAIAQTYLHDSGITIACQPSFLNIWIDDQERTAMCLVVEERKRAD